MACLPLLPDPVQSIIDTCIASLTEDSNRATFSALCHVLQAAPTHSEDAAAATAAADPSAAVEAVVQQYAAASGSTSLEPLRDFLTAAQRYHAAVVAAGRAGRGGRGGRGEGSDAAAATAGAATVEAARRPEPLVLEPLADKEARTAVHRLFKGLPSGAGGFPRLETSTVEAAAAAGAPDGSAAAAKPQQCVQVAVSGGRGGGDGGGGGGRGQGQKRRRDADDWAGGALRYTRFLLFKENMDSQVGLWHVGRRECGSASGSAAVQQQCWVARTLMPEKVCAALRYLLRDGS